MARIVFKPLRSANGANAQPGEIFFDTATKALAFKDTDGINYYAGGGTAALDTVHITGDVGGSYVTDNQNVTTLTLTLPDIAGLTQGTYTKLTVDEKGRVTRGTSLSSSDIPNIDWAKITTGKPTTLSGYGITDAASSTHTHAVATQSAAGLMSAADKTKLDGLASTVATTTTIGYMSAADKTKLDSVIVSNASQTAAGYMSAADKTKLDGLSNSVATATTNGLMSAADKTKLDGLSNSGGGITYDVATTTANGLMSAADKAKLDALAANTNIAEFTVNFTGSNPGSVTGLPSGWTSSINGTDVTITHTAGKPLKSIYYWGYSSSAGVENYRLPSASVPATIPYADRNTKFIFRITTAVAGADLDSNARIVVTF